MLVITNYLQRIQTIRTGDHIKKLLTAFLCSLIALLAATPVFADKSASLPSPSAPDTYLVSYLNGDDTTEFTQSLAQGQEIDLSLRLGGGEDQAGWSVSKGGSALSSYQMPEEDIVLYPVLNEAPVTYTVRFWKESLTPGQYDLEETALINADAGAAVSAETAIP